MSDTNHIICARAGASSSSDVRGAKRDNCETCGHAIIVSPSSYAIKDRGNAEFVCFECLHAIVERNKGVELKFQPLNDAQLAELKDYNRRKGN